MLPKLIAITLVLAGTAILCASIHPVWKIWNNDEQKRYGWKVLFAFILLFIIGYITVASLLISIPVASAEILMAVILLSGSVFVYLVSHLSLQSLQHINRAMALERHRALHDVLTDLPNRILLYERINQAIASAKRNAGSAAVMIMDLNRFKEINDTLGHHCGDRLLQQIAPMLKNNLRETDTVARLGGDEFAVVLPDTNHGTAVTIARKLQNTLRQPFMVEGHSLNMEMSIGIALFPQDGTDSDALLQSADVAMYMAKRSDSGYAMYDAEQDLYTVNRLNMNSRLRSAVENNVLEAHFQPVIDIANSGIYCLESLCRWHDGELGDVPPREFIPMAENAGVIQQLTLQMLDKSLLQLRKWHDKGYRFSIAVNLSIKDIQSVEFPRKLASKMAAHNIDARYVILEITESSMMTDIKRCFKVLSDLHTMKVRLSIDDFGTGYSSLSYLKQMPADILKIDKSFIRNMIDDDNDAVIVRSTIDLAHNMGRDVIAEGVENQDTYDILDILGCNYIQGFHVCPPLPAAAIDEWLPDNARTIDQQAAVN
jgi:diguanylate cyclase (GGDEF)-like protein